MTQSQRENIEAAALEECKRAYEWASRRMKEQEPSIAYEYGVRAGFKLGAEFALKMVFDDQINYHKKLLDEVSRESESGGI